MSRTGRPKKKVPSVRWTFYLPMTLAAEVEVLLLDPARDKIKYGDRNKVMESLLREWLNSQRKGVPQADPDTPADLQEAIQFHMGEANRLTQLLMGGPNGKLEAKAG